MQTVCGCVLSDFQTSLKHSVAPLPRSNMGPFLPYALVFLQVSTWGRKSPQLVSLFGPAASSSNWRRHLLNRAFTCKNTPGIWSKLFFLLTRPMKMEQTECSETSAHKFQTPGNHSKEKMQQIKVLFIIRFHYFLDKRLNGI